MHDVSRGLSKILELNLRSLFIAAIANYQKSSGVEQYKFPVLTVLEARSQRCISLGKNKVPAGLLHLEASGPSAGALKALLLQPDGRKVEWISIGSSSFLPPVAMGF